MTDSRQQTRALQTSSDACGIPIADRTPETTAQGNVTVQAKNVT